MHDKASAPASWVAVASIGIGAFALVTTEFLPIGLLPMIADDIGVSEGAAGLMVTVPGLVAACAAPGVIALTRGIDRRVVLSALLGLLALSNILVATATTTPMLLLGRVLLGIGVGGFWTVGGSLGPRLRPGPEGVRATSIIFSGVSFGTVAGLPAGSLLGNALGWRSAFFASAALAVLVVGALLVLVPSMPPEPGSGIREMPSILRLPLVRAGLIATVLIFAGHFAAYTYITPFLNDFPHIDGTPLSAVLLAFGIAGFVGNMAGGWGSRKAVRTVTASAAGLLGLSVAVLLITGSHPVSAIIAVVAWGFAFGIIPIAMQTFLFSAAPDKLESAAAAFVSIAQLSIGAGAFAGGLVVDNTGLRSALWLGAVLAVVSAVALVGLGRPRAARPEVSAPAPAMAGETA
ncbi:MFS transporter [Micromonospora vinacea]|uniref:MFS transporter n=1 Tax=Micromonospora vinacea TaxID=709878 RepID=UPI0034518066